VELEDPFAVGVDRLLNAMAAHARFGGDMICIDLGTATTIDCVTAAGVFLGGVIMPGVRTGAETLVRRTAQLPPVALDIPRRVIGRGTISSMQAGVMFGAADAIEGLVRRIRREWPGADSAVERGAEPGAKWGDRSRATPMVIATGGLATTMAPLCPSFNRVDPDLTLHGLRIAHRHLAGVPT
jgi:type III pantothenate kinase